MNEDSSKARVLSNRKGSASHGLSTNGASVHGLIMSQMNSDSEANAKNGKNL
jgi:hypothetical protein